MNELSENQIHLTTDLSKNIKGYPIQLIVDLDNFINYANTRMDNLLEILEREGLVILKLIVLLHIVTEPILNVLGILQMRGYLYYLL